MSRIPPAMSRSKVRCGRAVSSWIAGALCLLVAVTAPLAAHEVQPSVADLTIDARGIILDIEAILEPIIAGVDMAAVRDTDDAAEAEEVDRLRALSPEALEEAFRAHLPQLLARIVVTSGGAEVDLTLDRLRIPPPGDTDLPRISAFVLSGSLPPGDAPVTLRWDPALGALVLRQMGAGQDGYTGYLQSGGLSDPIARTTSGSPSWPSAFMAAIPEGFERIIPRGLDHAAFILGMVILSTGAYALVSQVAAFTLSHVAAMAVAMVWGVVPGPGILAGITALSLVYIGLAAIWARGNAPWHLAVVSLSGLAHGLTIGAGLRSPGVERSASFATFAGNVTGVELAQMAILLVACLALGLRFRTNGRVRRLLVEPAGIAISLFGGGLLAEGLLF